MEKAKKITEFYKKYKTLIFLPTITLLLFFAAYYEPLWIIASVLTAIFYLHLYLGDLFCYTFYFGLFSRVGTFYIVSLLIGFGLMIIRYVYDLIKKREKVYALPLILTILFIVLFSAINYGVDKNGLDQGVLVVSLLFVAYFVLVYGKTICPEKCFKFLSIGIFVSLVLGLITLLLPSYGFKIYYFDGTYKRLQLFTFHQNHLAIVCTFAICYYVYKLINKKGKLLVNIALIISFLLIGLFTLSKAFILTVAIIVLYLFVILIRKYKWKSLRFILPMIVFLAIFGICARDLIVRIFFRLTAYSKGESLINQITTGRSDIWNQYFIDLTTSIPKFLFGVGIFTKELISVGPHNVLIYFLYRTGIIGIILLSVIIWSYLRECKGKLKFKLNNCLLFVMFLIVAMEEMIFSDRFFFFLILGILLMRTETKESQTNIIGENSETTC